MTGDGTNPQMVLKVNGGERATWSVAAGESYRPYSTETPLTGQDVFEVWYTNDNEARELWVDAVNMGGPPPVEMPYHVLLPALRHAEGAPEPPAPPAGEGVTIQAPSAGSGQALGGAMLYGRGSFDAPNGLP